MIEVEVESIRISLMSEHRVIILKALEDEWYLPIWVGPFEAEAIAIRLKNVEVSRPLTHDLLKNMIKNLGGSVSHILVDDLRDDTFYAHIHLDVNGQPMSVDSRPSDAIALAVRVGVPIYVEEEVMRQAGIFPDDDVSEETEEDLGAFRDFVEDLDLGEL